MADYYELFSEAIADLTAEEIVWIEASLGSEIEVGENDEALKKELGLDEVYQWPPCAWEIQEGAKGKFLWIHSDDTFDGDALVAWLQAFLKKFRPNDVVKIGIACTVSRPLLGEFGGRWIVVASKDAFFGSTWDEIDTQLKGT